MNGLTEYVISTLTIRSFDWDFKSVPVTRTESFFVILYSCLVDLLLARFTVTPTTQREVPVPFGVKFLIRVILS